MVPGMVFLVFMKIGVGWDSNPQPTPKAFGATLSLSLSLSVAINQSADLAEKLRLEDFSSPLGALEGSGRFNTRHPFG
jgi:hypothetical protein